MGAGINSLFAANIPPIAPLVDPQEKINRELFVGNTPPGTSELLLMQFLNGAMARTNLVTGGHIPIIQCRVNNKFSFIECATAEDANKALNVSGIPFMGMSLRISRPSKYAGPHVPHKTWQQLTGIPLPPGITPIPENAPNAGLTPEEKVNRELFVGNTTPEMTEQLLMDFLGKAMQQVGLTTQPGNPITTCRLSGKFAFVELRSPEEARNALNLNNIPYMGATLRVGRPSKYTGEHTPHGNWEDILSKYMSGELKLPSEGGAGVASSTVNVNVTTTSTTATTSSSSTTVPTTVVELKHMLTEQDLEDDQEYQEIMEDTKEECSQFGALKNIVIPRTGVGMTKIFLEYMSKDDSVKAIQGLQGRTFDGRKVQAIYFDESKFASGDYSDS